MKNRRFVKRLLACALTAAMMLALMPVTALANTYIIYFNCTGGGFSIPMLGYVSDYIQDPPGSYVAIGIGAALILAVFLPDLFKKKKTDQASDVNEEETK